MLADSKGYWTLLLQTHHRRRTSFVVLNTIITSAALAGMLGVPLA